MPINVQEVTTPVVDPINEPGLDKLLGTAGTISLSPVSPSMATPPKLVTLSDVAKAAQTAMAQSEQELKVKLETLSAPLSVEDLIKVQYQQQANADFMNKAQQGLIAYTSSLSSAIKAVNDQLIPNKVADQPIKLGDVVLAKLWKASQDYADKQVTGLGMEPDLITGTPVCANSFGMPLFSGGARHVVSVLGNSTSVNAFAPAQPAESAF